MQCVSFVDNLTYFWLLFHGFHFYRMSLFYTFTVFPPRLQTLVGTSLSPAPDLSYWYRPHTSRNKLPVLFLHGIGIGLYPYSKFLVELNQKDVDGEVGLIAVEIMPISFRITGEAMTRSDLCKQILAILEHHGFDEFVLVSHS
jgi:pimeloyl-ACP methyl ester carboxylesterase